MCSCVPFKVLLKTLSAASPLCTAVIQTTKPFQHTVCVIKIKLKAIILLNVPYLFQKSVTIFHRDPEPHDVFVPSWHEFVCASTVEAGLLQ
jgi:hypothetical protein